MHLGAIHLLSAKDTPADDVLLVAALVLAEEVEAPDAQVGDFITVCFLPGLLACLRFVSAFGSQKISSL